MNAPPTNAPSTNATTDKRLSYENRTVIILSIVGGVAAIDMMAFNFLGPFIAADLHLSNGQIGLIGGTGLLTWALGAISSAFLSDRIGRRRIFLIGALLSFALFSLATAFAMTFATLIAARLIVGLSEGPVVPIQNAIMLAESSPHRRGLNMGMVQNLGPQLVGGIFGPLALIAIATRLGWRDAFLVAAAPAVLMVVIVRLCVREPAHSGKPALRLPPWNMIRAIARVRNIRLCFLIGICVIGWLMTTTVFIPLWIVNQLRMPPSALGIVIAAIGVGGALASVIAPALSDRFGRRPVLVSFTLTGVILPVGMLLAPASLPLLCAVVCVGSLFTGIMPLFIGIIPMESVDARHGATASAMVMGAAQITGSFVGPILAGQLADRWSVAAPFWLSIALALGACFFSLFIVETAAARGDGNRAEPEDTIHGSHYSDVARSSENPSKDAAAFLTQA